MDKQALLDKISQSTKLPILPAIALRVIELNNDPDLYPAKLQSVLSSDPTLAARILQLSNSSMFRCQREIADLGEAIAVLGVQLTMSVATGFAIVDSMREDKASDEFPHEAFWRKSVLGAIAANELHSQFQNVNRGELFVASLMQDIGMLALYAIAGGKYAQLVRATRSHFDLVELENRVFGLNHAEVGEVLLGKWGLPESICQAVARSHALFNETSTFELTDSQYAVAFAGILSELWIAESSQLELLQQNIRAYLEKVGEESYRNTVSSILDSIPGANQMFNMQLLSDEQMANVA